MPIITHKKSSNNLYLPFLTTSNFSDKELVPNKYSEGDNRSSIEERKLVVQKKCWIAIITKKKKNHVPKAERKIHVLDCHTLQHMFRISEEEQQLCSYKGHTAWYNCIKGTEYCFKKRKTYNLGSNYTEKILKYTMNFKIQLPLWCHARNRSINWRKIK